MRSNRAQESDGLMRGLYDVIVVGSGAGGGTSAYVLTQAGLKVLMLEAGREYDPIRETPMFQVPSEAPLHGASTPDKPGGYYDATVDGGHEVPGEPYAIAEDSPVKFRWWRARMLGGRTNHWGRLSLRFGPYDFKPRSRDGLGVDWPISYEDLAPWYDKVERFIGVAGANEGLENTPVSPPGVLLPPFPFRAREYFLQKGLQSMGIPVAAARLAILTQAHNGRPPCLYATPCLRGCSIAANFQSTTMLIPQARATGNLNVRTNALVYQVDLGQGGRASGVSFVDRITGTHHSVRGKSVVLAASTAETARILLNSNTSAFPNGVANESGQVGRNLTDTLFVHTVGQFPALEKLGPRNDDGASIFHMYVPWWGYQQQARKQLDFPRGYHIEPHGKYTMPEMDEMSRYADDCQASHGVAFKDEMRRKYGSYISFSGRGEMIPNERTFVDLHPTLTDKWGIPAPRFHWQWGESELRQAAHQHCTYLQIIDRLGGRFVPEQSMGIDSPLPTGVHETGTARMGFSDKDSVVNSYGQSWSVRNLFIMDGSVLASHPRSPTLTIIALAWRNSDYLVDQARKMSL